MFASFLASLRSSYRGLTTPPPQTAAVEAPQPPRPQDDIESGAGGDAITHNPQNALPSILQLSIFHGPTAPPPQTAAAAAPQPVPLPLEGAESDGSSASNALPSMENLAVPATICVGVYAVFPTQEKLNSDPLRYSPLVASIFLAVAASILSLLWHRTPRYHQRRRRSIEVAVVSLVFSYLLRIILDLLPAGKPLIFVAGFLFLQIGFAAIYVLSPPRHPNSSPV